MQGWITSHGLLVAHLDVFKLINLSNCHFSHDIVLDPVHEGFNLLLQFFEAFRLVQHRYDQVARGCLDCNRACYEHNNYIVDNVFSILVLRVLKKQADNVTVIWVVLASLFFNNSMNKAAKAVNIRKVARVDCKDLLLIEAWAEHNEWVGFYSGDHIFHKLFHVKTNSLLGDFARRNIGVGHSLVGIAGAD